MEHQQKDPTTTFTNEDFVNLQKSVRNIEESIKGLEISKKNQNSIDVDDFEDVFPIETLDELQKFENRLKKEDDFRKNVVNFM